jgi:long-chain acyl-CoA synthetase
MVSTVAGASLHKDLNLTKETAYLSYLPLAHCLERIVFAVITYYGGYYGFYNGDVQKIKDDINELRPHVFTSVPRLFNRFSDTIKSGLDKLTGVKK